MAMKSIEWHKNNLINSINFELRLAKELKASIANKLDYINGVAFSNGFKLFQLDLAVCENKNSFTDRYKEKLYKTKNIKDKYKIIITF